MDNQGRGTEGQVTQTSDPFPHAAYEELQARFAKNGADEDRATRISMWVFRVTLVVMIGLTVHMLSQSPTINECTNAHPNELTVSEPNGRNER